MDGFWVSEKFNMRPFEKNVNKSQQLTRDRD